MTFIAVHGGNVEMANAMVVVSAERLVNFIFVFAYAATTIEIIISS